MGYYHVNETGKGINIKNFDNINQNYKLPPLDYIKSYLEWKDGSCEKDLSLLPEMDIYHQIAYLGLDDYDFSEIIPCIKKNIQGKHQQILGKDFCEEYDENYSMYFSNEAANVFELLFCYRYGYPFGCFKGVSDYDDNIMFFCNLQFPPKEYNKKLLELTEEVFIKELREFFSDFLDDDYYKTVELEICEEYIKE